MTAGEQRVAQALGPQASLDRDFRWWQEPTLRDLKKGTDRCPDFVILDQSFGLLVLEVKDWVIDQIIQADAQHWNVRKGGVTRSETAPAEQGRTASHVLKQIMEAETRLVHMCGIHQGKAMLPVNYGAVLPNIARAEAEEHHLIEVIGTHVSFFADDLYGAARNGADTFPTILRARVQPRFSVPRLSTAQIETIGAAIAPKRAISKSVGLTSDAEQTVVDRLDAEQVSYARSLGDGHRILTECAGSGKTLVVAARARFLKEANPHWRIRIICYNAELVPHIYRLLGDMQSDAEPKITVQNFHAYARECLGNALQSHPGESTGALAERTASEFIAFAANASDHGAYDALLIDEGQDLRPEWTRSLVALVNPKTNSVFFCASRQQNIYGIASYKNMGLEASGRTKHLRRSYRCSQEILSLAEAFQPDVVQKRKFEEHNSSGSLFTSSERGSRRLPQFVACQNPAAMCRYICDEVGRYRRAELCAFRDIAILYTDRYLPVLEPLAGALCAEFGSQHIFSKWKQASSTLPDEDSIKMTTVHGSKGLEWRVVFLLGMEKVPRANVAPEQERSLAYVALTRAQDEIHFVFFANRGFTKT